MKVQIIENLKLKKKKIKISKITFEREQQRGNNESIYPINLSELKRKAFVIDEHSKLKKKKKINHNFHYEIRNPRTTQEREKIELGNGEEKKNDNERERAYRFVEVKA